MKQDIEKENSISSDKEERKREREYKFKIKVKKIKKTKKRVVCESDKCGDMRLAGFAGC